MFPWNKNPYSQTENNIKQKENRITFSVLCFTFLPKVYSMIPEVICAHRKLMKRHIPPDSRISMHNPILICCCPSNDDRSPVTHNFVSRQSLESRLT
ncbi:hypothetical protein TNCT_451001 [Trichonephila clavata]|uniref:Uncharacterized protein n=1 Tax=Trichonephila clavata TaxID=2740835 RepID=A0A8X6G1G2_TRICU|nr:hypothetical protein TNCT_451001 [Trichonephila clavata]